MGAQVQQLYAECSQHEASGRSLDRTNRAGVAGNRDEAAPAPVRHASVISRFYTANIWSINDGFTLDDRRSG
jgi:hypothetical protein